MSGRRILSFPIYRSQGTIGDIEVRNDILSTSFLIFDDTFHIFNSQIQTVGAQNKYITKLSETRMHSSRMRSAHSSTITGGADRDPPGQRPPWTETPLDRESQTETPLDRDPPDRDPLDREPPPPWTETSLDRDPFYWRKRVVVVHIMFRLSLLICVPYLFDCSRCSGQ